MDNETFTKIIGVLTPFFGILSILTTCEAVSMAYSSGYWDGPNITENTLGAVVLLLYSASFFSYRPKTPKGPKIESRDPSGRETKGNGLSYPYS